MHHNLYSWQSSHSALPKGAKVFTDDWSFVNAEGDYHARLYYVDDSEIMGSWCWRVWIDQKLHKGVALSKADAKEVCERILLTHGVIDTYFNRNMLSSL